MRNGSTRKIFWVLFTFILLLGFGTVASAEVDQRIYDEAGLLSEAEISGLEAYAAEKSRERGVDFLMLTTNSTEGLDIATYQGNFFDDFADTHGQENAVLLTIDMGNRNYIVSGYGTAERNLDDQRIDQLLDQVAPYMAAGQYGAAFEETISTADRYMDYRPGVNPDSIFLQTWFQAAVSLLLGGIVVGTMLYNSGGRNTTTPATYIDRDNTRVVQNTDRFRNKTVTRRKIPKNNNSGGGGFGGGGMTGGGRSFSGGGRGF